MPVTMTKKNIVKRTLCHYKSSETPYHIKLSRLINSRLQEHFGVDDLVKEARNLVNELGQNGGYILTPGIIVQEDVPMENILAFIDMCQQQAF